MDRSAAQQHILNIFSNYKSIAEEDADALTGIKSDGKVYELYCLATTLDKLEKHCGASFKFCGSDIKFKSSGGQIKNGDPHFEISFPGDNVKYCLYTDIEFYTLSHKHNLTTGNSSHHEIDIVLVEDGIVGNPNHDQIHIGIECKSNAVLKKHVAREILGYRRELSFLSNLNWSILSTHDPIEFSPIRADPSSEYWIAFTDPGFLKYASGPDYFGIRFMHWPV